MYFSVLALEEAENDPNLTVLNYAPGPVQTDMTADVELNSVSDAVRTIFNGLRDEQSYLQPIDTTLKFIKLIETGSYVTGAHVDYYDF